MQIVYYSLNGTTEKVARQLAAFLDLPLYRIEDVSSRKGFFRFIYSGFEARAKRKPKIRPIEDFTPDPDHIVLLGPVWAGNMASPVRTFCTQYTGRTDSVSLILTHQDTKNAYEFIHGEIAELLAAKPSVFGSFCDKQIQSEDVLALGKRLKDKG